MSILSLCMVLLFYALPAEFDTTNCTVMILLPPPVNNQTIHCNNTLFTINNQTLNVNDEENNLAKAIIEIHLTDSDVRLIFLNVTMNSLEKLYLSNNSISGLNRNTFGPLPRLEHLDLSRNELEDKDIQAFRDMPSLKLLNLSRNHLKTVDSRGFDALPKLETLDVSRNALYRISATLVRGDHGHLSALYLQHNRLLTVNLKVLSLMRVDASFNAIRSVNLPDLLQLRLNNNKIRDLISFGDVEIDVSNNDVTNFRAASENTVSITASYNRIATVTRSFFPHSKRLEHLDLSHNIIAYIEKNALATLQQVRFMNLSHNKMSDFKFRVFDNLNALETLDISYNNFVNLYHVPSVGTFRFDNVANLSKIILNNNQLLCGYLKKLSRESFGIMNPRSACARDANDFTIVYEKIAWIEGAMSQTEADVIGDEQDGFETTTDYVSYVTQTGNANQSTVVVILILTISTIIVNI